MLAGTLEDPWMEAFPVDFNLLLSLKNLIKRK